MTLKEDMHTLAQGILGSYDTRTTRLASLRQEVTGQREDARVFIHDLGQAHQAIAQQQRKRLAQGRTDVRREEGRRKAQTHAVMRGVATAHAEATREWQGLTATLHARRGGGTTTEAPTPGRHSTKRGSRGGGSQGQGGQNNPGAE